MGDTVLGSTVKEKDLGVTSADMKVSEQYCIAASKGNQILGSIRRNIIYKKDIDTLERIQRKATKMIPELRPYQP